MPIFAAWVGSLITSIATFFAAFLTKRVAIVLAVIVAAGAFTVTFIAGLNAIIAGIVYAIPPSISLGMSWFIPSNMDDCIAAIMAAHVLRWVYDWNIKVIQWKLV